MSSKQEHPYHLVDMSPWPILTSFSLLALTMGGVMALHEKPGGSPMAIFGLIAVIFCSWSWWRDIVNEGLVGKHHSEPVRNGLRIGMHVNKTVWISCNFGCLTCCCKSIPAVPSILVTR